MFGAAARNEKATDDIIFLIVGGFLVPRTDCEGQRRASAATRGFPRGEYATLEISSTSQKRGTTFALETSLFFNVSETSRKSRFETEKESRGKRLTRASRVFRLSAAKTPNTPDPPAYRRDGAPTQP